MVDPDLYAGKSEAYFSGERRDFVDKLEAGPKRAILEIGCGGGATGAYAKKTGKCGTYVGVEIDAAAARRAAEKIDEVHVANIEAFKMPYPEGFFDIVIASEVLEHLVDPWRVLRKVRNHMKPGGLLFASSPNVSHKSIIKMLLGGKWDLELEGPMDRTHLRWFTPKTYATMFEDSGFEVLEIGPLAPPGGRARLFNKLTGNRLDHLFISQICVMAKVAQL